jgi:hypothetical protein
VSARLIQFSPNRYVNLDAIRRIEPLGDHDSPQIFRIYLSNDDVLDVNQEAMEVIARTGAPNSPPVTDDMHSFLTDVAQFLQDRCDMRGFTLGHVANLLGRAKALQRGAP